MKEIIFENDDVKWLSLGREILLNGKLLPLTIGTCVDKKDEKKDYEYLVLTKRNIPIARISSRDAKGFFSMQSVSDMCMVNNTNRFSELIASHVVDGEYDILPHGEVGFEDLSSDELVCFGTIAKPSMYCEEIPLDVFLNIPTLSQEILTKYQEWVLKKNAELPAYLDRKPLVDNVKNELKEMNKIFENVENSKPQNLFSDVSFNREK